MARWDQDSEPTIPEWFFEAVETEASEHMVEIAECDVAYRTWPASGSANRDMLLIHGMYAHSHWWDFIAPRLLDSYRITAMDLFIVQDIAQEKRPEAPIEIKSIT